MRVLLINDHGRAYGGAELQMLSIRDRLRSRGHDVRLFASSAELVAGYPMEADRVCHGRSDLLQVALQSANPAAWWCLRKELKDFTPDVVHIRSFLWQLSPLILPALKNFPVLLQVPTYKEICPNGLKLRPDGTNCAIPAGAACHQSNCVSRRTYRAARVQQMFLRRWREVIDITAVLSRTAARVFADNGWPDVEVLYNPAAERQQRTELAATPTVMYSGRLSREKGVDTLIKAFAEACKKSPDAKLLIAGTGQQEVALRAQAAPLGQAIEFLGHLSPASLDRMAESAWVHAVPSIWDEPFGNVTLEAMMRGVAVLGSSTGATPELVVENVTGRIATAGDVSSWSQHLCQMLSNKEICIEMGRAGRRRALSDFGLEQHTEQVLNLYERARAAHALRHGRMEIGTGQKEALR